jgi:serine protease Do
MKIGRNGRVTGLARCGVALLGAMVMLPWGNAAGQTAQRAGTPDALHQLNDSIEALVRRVSPSVVQIVVRGYRSTEASVQGQADVIIGRERAIGSGVIVDPEGYIVTNAHVLTGAQQIEVIVPVAGTAAVAPDTEARGQSYQARVVGIARELDLAVVKIDAHKLPALSIKAVTPKQGEMVFAFGSPEGLRNTVTMGVVSSVARQPDPDSPLVYVQTADLW